MKTYVLSVEIFINNKYERRYYTGEEYNGYTEVQLFSDDINKAKLFNYRKFCNHYCEGTEVSIDNPDIYYTATKNQAKRMNNSIKFIEVKRVTEVIE